MRWLEAYQTNNDPHVVAGNFLGSVINADVRLRLEQKMDMWLKCRGFCIVQKPSLRQTVLCSATGNRQSERWRMILQSECVQYLTNREDGYFSDNFLDPVVSSSNKVTVIQVIDTHTYR